MIQLIWSQRAQQISGIQQLYLQGLSQRKCVSYLRSSVIYIFLYPVLLGLLISIVLVTFVFPSWIQVVDIMGYKHTVTMLLITLIAIFVSLLLMSISKKELDSSNSK